MSTVSAVNIKTGTIAAEKITKGIISAYGAPAAPVLSRTHTFRRGEAVHQDWEKQADGTILVRNFRVFKAGTFKDSFGEQRTWDKAHLEQMVFNFSLLRNGGLLTDLPVRDGHPSLFGGGGDVIGWHEDVRQVDGFIDVDFRITDDGAVRKWENGTFRARSSEVGYYETNDEALYYPVYLGFAFVDIGAVEGLYEAAKQDEDKFTILMEKEHSVGKDNEEQTNPPAPTPPGEASANTPDGGSAEQQDAPTPTSGQQSVQGGESGNGGEGSGQHGSPAPFQFSIRGQATSDFAAVQRHITALEEAQTEMEMSARADFVNGLAGRGVVPATKLDDTIEYAKGLTDAQFEQYKALYADAEGAPLFAMHGNGVSNASGEPETGDEQVQTDLEVIANFQRAKLDPKKIMETKAYQRLKDAGKAPNL